MDDTFRLDLEGYDKAYIEDVFNGFIENAHRHGRKLLEIRVSRSMFERLEIEEGAVGAMFKDVPVVIASVPLNETIEIIVGKPQ